MTQSYIQALDYTFDAQTEMCFASHGLGWNNAIFTQVPCTEKVMAAISLPAIKVSDPKRVCDAGGKCYQLTPEK